MTPAYPPRRSLAALALAVTLACRVAAQSAPSPSAEAPDRVRPTQAASAVRAAAAAPAEEETIQLSPFTVSTEKDSGYMAADVISGGLLATNLLKTAADVTVLTRDFLDDINASSIADVQVWLASSDPESNPSNNGNPTDFGYAADFRGVGHNGNLRNYWPAVFTPQRYAVDRVEGSRGPNAILYGAATQSGKVNIGTKSAKFHDFATLELRLDSFGAPFGRGAYLDVNRRLTRDWAVRLNLQDSKMYGWYDRSFNDARGLQFATTYHPWHGGELKFEAEKDFTSGSTFRPDSLNDTQSLWDRVLVVKAKKTTGSGFGGGVTRMATNWVFVPGLGVQNWQNLGRTTGTNVALLTDLDFGRDTIPNMPVLPRREFNPNTANEKMDNHMNEYNLTLSHTFDSGLTVQAGGEYNENIKIGDTIWATGAYVDVNTIQPDLTPNPNLGRTYSQIDWNPLRTAHYASNARLAAAYPLKTRWFTQTFSLVGQYNETLGTFKAWAIFRENGALAPNGTIDNNQRVHAWRYWDDLTPTMPAPESDALNTYRWVMSRDQHTTTHSSSITASTVGSYLHDTLTIIGGVRRDLFHGATRDIQKRDPVTADIIQAGGIWSDVGVNTSQISATYFPIKSWGVYGYKSDGFNPNLTNVPKIDGSGPYNLVRSWAKGGGLRFNLLNGRVVGTIGYYDSFEKDKEQQQGLGTINNIWTAIANAGGPNYQLVQTGGLYQYADTTSVRSWGWEGDLTANLTKGLKLTVNGSIPHTKQTNSLRDTKAYYAANIAEWSKWRDYTDGAGKHPVDDALKTLETLAFTSSADGRPLNGLYRYRANVFGNYTIQSGWLKRLRLGAGANFFGPMIIDSPPGDSTKFLYGDAYYLATGTLGYSFKVRGRQVSMNLSVSNLLNYQEPIFRKGGTRIVSNVQYRDTYYWPVPLSVQLNTSIKF